MEPRDLRHGYRIEESAAPEGRACSLAFHLRPRRQWYGDLGITQAELAQVAGVSRNFVTHLENACDLQVSVERTLRIAFALGHPVEDIVAPQRLAAMKAEVEKRCAELAARRVRRRRV